MDLNIQGESICRYPREIQPVLGSSDPDDASDSIWFGTPQHPAYSGHGDGRSPVAFITSHSVKTRMAEILAENLSGKSVTGSDGAELGLLYNITMDHDSGELVDLVVDPNEHIQETSFDRDEQGHLLIPVSRVQAVKDHMIVKR